MSSSAHKHPLGFRACLFVFFFDLRFFSIKVQIKFSAGALGKSL